VLSRLLEGHEALRVHVASFLAPREALLLFGGASGHRARQINSDMGLYCSRTCTWRKLGQMRSRACGAACVVPGHRIVFVGYNPVSLASIAEMFDVLTARWEPLPALRWARRACAVATLGSHAYVVGGGSLELERAHLRLQQALSVAFEEPERLSEEEQQLVETQLERPGFQSLDCANQVERIYVDGRPHEWESLPALSDVALAEFPAAGCLGSMLVVAGGEVSGSPIDTCWGYEPARGAWKELPPLPAARFNCGFCVHPRLGLVLAGGRGCDRQALTSVLALRSAEEGWGALADLGAPRSGGALALLRGELLLLLGGAGDGARGAPEAAFAERYVQAEDRWEAILHMQHQQALENCCAFGVVACHAEG